MDEERLWVILQELGITVYNGLRSSINIPLHTLKYLEEKNLIKYKFSSQIAHGLTIKR